MTENDTSMKTIIFAAALGSGTPLVTGFATYKWQDQMEWSVRILTMLAGLIVALFCGWFAYRKAKALARKAEAEAEVAELDLCDRCKAGDVPERCPFPAEMRPKNCPVKQAGVDFEAYRQGR